MYKVVYIKFLKLIYRNYIYLGTEGCIVLNTMELTRPKGGPKILGLSSDFGPSQGLNIIITNSFLPRARFLQIVQREQMGKFL